MKNVPNFMYKKMRKLRKFTKNKLAVRKCKGT